MAYKYRVMQRASPCAGKAEEADDEEAVDPAKV